MLVMGDCEVDHHKPDFKDMVDSFMKDFKHLDFSVSKKSGFCESFDDPATLDSWVTYHKQHANLRLLSIEGHRSKSMIHKRQDKVPIV
tara:strand:+ start:102 stop:365 length:264 start_codon:yes stop_codon:yes gene_type:complete